MLCYDYGRDEKGLAGCVDERHEEYKITKRLLHATAYIPPGLA